MSNSLEPVRYERRKVYELPASLQSSASALTVKPSLEAPPEGSAARAPRPLSLGVVALGALSTILGLGGAVSVSHLRGRPAPVMQIVSGSPALKKSADGADVRWHAHRSSLYLDSSLDRLGPGAREAVQLGFGTWVGSGAKLPSLSFDSTTGAEFGKEPNGKSEVMYGTITLPGHENDLALTVTFSDPKTGEVIEADMIFNSSHPYGLLPYQGPVASMTREDLTLCAEKYDLQSVATHEAGHFFGLGEDYDSSPATMFYTTGRCETNKRILQGSDESTMDALYVESGGGSESAIEASSANAKGCGGAQIGQGRPSYVGSALSALGLIGLVTLRRRRR